MANAQDTQHLPETTTVNVTLPRNSLVPYVESQPSSPTLAEEDEVSSIPRPASRRSSGTDRIVFSAHFGIIGTNDNTSIPNPRIRHNGESQHVLSDINVRENAILRLLLNLVTNRPYLFRIMGPDLEWLQRRAGELGYQLDPERSSSTSQSPPESNADPIPVPPPSSYANPHVTISSNHNGSSDSEPRHGIHRVPTPMPGTRSNDPSPPQSASSNSTPESNASSTLPNLPGLFHDWLTNPRQLENEERNWDDWRWRKPDANEAWELSTGIDEALQVPLSIYAQNLSSSPTSFLQSDYQLLEQHLDQAHPVPSPTNQRTLSPKLLAPITRTPQTLTPPEEVASLSASSKLPLAENSLPHHLTDLPVTPIQAEWEAAFKFLETDTFLSKTPRMLPTTMQTAPRLHRFKQSAVPRRDAQSLPYSVEATMGLDAGSAEISGILGEIIVPLSLSLLLLFTLIPVVLTPPCPLNDALPFAAIALGERSPTPSPATATRTPPDESDVNPTSAISLLHMNIPVAVASTAANPSSPPIAAPSNVPNAASQSPKPANPPPPLMTATNTFL
ncbi:uncharacterized protein STEHIDRAFT_152669 [Stereum hirsutum FP-91666 SS1]|uniref:uncharacterized protein n=1 Tax=Stereum hirsutum (strain FP-91666) TaxID=721885 RepID=UPI000440B108|nr:uncharacterized protein STEHIDRAFT_152669 [Stereum hirsutum FP-91666 SS1]EIM90984.1 hypothetical protein STEHIDRAFT_152669 [Stereum hirsutum FP-91666 SS1]